jgi:hypothetical protein
VVWCDGGGRVVWCGVIEGEGRCSVMGGGGIVLVGTHMVS